MAREIHSTAIIDSKAELGENVTVGPYSIIGPNVQIGDGCEIRSHVVVEGLTKIGSESRIWQFASVGSEPQDLKFSGEPSELILGTGNVIREYSTLQPGTRGGNMKTVVGDNNLFMACSHVGHDCVIGNNNVFANSASLAGHVTIENNVILGGMVGIHQFSRIGDYVMLSAGSMVGSDVPPYCIGQGDRAHLRGVNVIGLQRAGFSEEQIRNVKRAYRSLFSTVGNVQSRIETLEDELRQDSAVSRMIEFIESTDRGICQPFKSLNNQ